MLPLHEVKAPTEPEKSENGYVTVLKWVSQQGHNGEALLLHSLQEPSLFLGHVGQLASRHGTLYSLHVPAWGENIISLWQTLMSVSRSLSRGACPRVSLLFSYRWLASSTPAAGLCLELSRIIQKLTPSSWPSLLSLGEPSVPSWWPSATTSGPTQSSASCLESPSRHGLPSPLPCWWVEPPLSSTTLDIIP